MDSQLGLIDQSFNSRYTSWVHEALDELPDNFTITDPCISGHPIVFASKGFLEMSGYLKNEVIGRNGRIFQGPRTNRRSIMEIREAIREEKSIQISLLNYKKDGTPFWMLFHLSPVFSKEDGRVIHFISVQVPILRKVRSEDANRWQEIVFGSCRREVCSDTVAELNRARALDSFVDSDNRVLEAEETCEANDTEKRKAASAIGSIISLLTHYSELTGKLVCGKRCSNSSMMGPLSSSLNISLGRIKQSFVLTDPHLPDMPIVYASDAFLILTGYSRHEVLGRNCRFLNGPDTDPKTICQIRESIEHDKACSVRILNYRKDGSSFWNLLHISSVRNSTGRIAFYIGVQIEEGRRSEGREGLSPEMRQLGTVGAVKVAIRSLAVGAGCSR
uniref:Putative LOV domain-containing protein n=1 Tax=Eschscholzia californica TaxID=3467 RepID=A0A126WWX8_ESCCA|nr:putative LOV domain-containing protein [Eschscholzia californica]